MELRWWEKTVEYGFVIEMARQGRMAIAPLDGKHELLGDAIFSRENRWMLIEFKKDRQSLATERDKYTNYSAARDALSTSDGHHTLVYGEAQLDEKGRPRLGFRIRTYFSERPLALEQMFQAGAGYEAFAEYVKRLTSLKKSAEGSSGGGGLGIQDYSLVAGVSTDSKIVECLPLSEYELTLGIERRLERGITKERPSRGFER